ncbi:MAG: hypothetical protein ABFS86_06845 [Planctomycetota bacterium]
MSDERNYTPYQKGVIRRYYQNREAASTQRLGEIVTDLYLATNEKKVARLWEQVEKLLSTAGANEKWVAGVVRDRNLEALAEIVSDLF